MEVKEEFVFYAIDFEGSRKTGILEYGLVGASSIRGIFSAETHLCKNKTAIPANEFEYHRLQAHMLYRCQDFSYYLPQLLALRAHSFFCAHNATFENTLLHAYCPIVFEVCTIPGYPACKWGPWIDTFILYKKYFQYANGSLQALIEEYVLQGILLKLAEKFCPPGRRTYHCALFDALACALLLLNFVRQKAFQTKTLRWLLCESSPNIITEQLRQMQLLR